MKYQLMKRLTWTIVSCMDTYACPARSHVSVEFPHLALPPPPSPSGLSPCYPPLALACTLTSYICSNN
jgi:hypothetical protein